MIELLGALSGKLSSCLACQPLVPRQGVDNTQYISYGVELAKGAQSSLFYWREAGVLLRRRVGVHTLFR